MAQPIEAASRAQRDAPATHRPQTAAEAGRRPDRPPQMRAARLFALALLPIVMLVNTLFSRPAEAATDPAAPAPGEADGSGPVDEIARETPARVEGDRHEDAATDAMAPENAGADEEAPAPPARLGQPVDVTPVTLEPVAPLKAAAMSLPQANGPSAPTTLELPEPVEPAPLAALELTAPLADLPPRPAATAPAPAAPAAPAHPGAAAPAGGEPPRPEPATPSEDDALATLLEDIGLWIAEMPALSVAQVTDLVVGDLMQEVPLDELTRQVGMIDTPSGLPFLAEIAVLRDPSAGEHYAAQAGLPAPGAAPSGALDPVPDPVLEPPVPDLA